MTQQEFRGIFQVCRDGLRKASLEMNLEGGKMTTTRTPAGIAAAKGRHFGKMWDS